MGDVSKLPPKLRERLAARGIIGGDAKPEAKAEPAGPTVLRSSIGTWVLVRDQAGKEYFWDTATGATSWTDPASADAGEEDTGPVEYEDELDCLSMFAGRIIGKKGSVLRELKHHTMCD